MKKADAACLQCSLPICDDKDKRCAFVQINREERRPYFKARYERFKAEGPPKQYTDAEIKQSIIEILLSF